MNLSPLSETPLVSVVLPVLNGARFIEAAITSVLEQDWRPLELIVVDGGSTDGTRELLASIVAPEMTVITQIGAGIPNAWNHGIASARGDLVAFLSSDDWWTPGKLTTQIAALLSNPQLLYSIGHFQYHMEAGCTIPSSFNRELLGRILVGRIMETLVARREAFEIVGMFDERYATAEDVDWYARASERATPHIVVTPIVLMKRIHDANSSSNAATNSPRLLNVLRRSIARRRGESE